MKGVVQLSEMVLPEISNSGSEFAENKTKAFPSLSSDDKLIGVKE